MNKGSRNLLVLGIAVIVFALASTSISLAIYHNSGDIYLDRSRPGFLPDESEVLTQDDTYAFPDSGTLHPEDLIEYLEHYNLQLEYLDSLGDPFSAAALSDEALGIPED